MLRNILVRVLIRDSRGQVAGSSLRLSSLLRALVVSSWVVAERVIAYHVSNAGIAACFVAVVWAGVKVYVAWKSDRLVEHRMTHISSGKRFDGSDDA